MDTLFIEIAAVVITAGLLSLVLYILRQPLIIAYIATGLIVGPSLLGFTKSPEVFTALSEIGIAFLLFLVGINLNWRKVKDVGAASMIAGLGQVTFTTAIGYGLCLLLGFDSITSIFIATAFAFSSTIVIVKLLSDKEDLDRFYGRISVGVLIVQDLIAMVILLIVGAMRDGTGSLEMILLSSGLKAVIVISGLWLLAKFVLPHLFHYAARSQELLFLTAVSWCFAIASALYLIGFGIEIGALMAGVAIAGSSFHREIESKIRPLRDFFLIIFFIVLGTHLTVDSVGVVMGDAIILSLFILIGNPFIVLVLMRLFGFHPRTGVLVGFNMAQISEFSFILLTVAIAAGFVDDQVMVLATVAGLITIAASTYLINYNEFIYRALEPIMKPLEIKPTKEREGKREISPKVIVFGYEHLAEAMLPAVKRMKEPYVVVDFDPGRIEQMKEQKIPSEYGDAGNEDFLSYLRADKAKLIISTIPDAAVNGDIVTFIKERHGRATVVLTAKNVDEARALYKLGANFVILPNVLGGELFAELLKKKQARKTNWNMLARKQRKAMGV